MLAANVSNGKVTLSWNASNDGQTPANGLSYQVRLGTSAGAQDIISAMATSTGKRLNAHMGNAQSGTQFDILDLPAGTYYWSVQAIDNSFKPSPFAAEHSFVVATSPLLTTQSISSIQSTTADGGGNITDDGGSAVTARGIVWGTSTNPTLASNLGMTTDGSGTGTYTSSLTGLTQNTTYYVRAYATNAMGTSYGNEIQFISAKQLDEVYAGTFPGVYDGEVAWVDYDRDGDLDVSLTGRDGSSNYTRLYRNNGNSFTLVFNGQFPHLYYSSLDWADYDHDGYPDLLLTGYNGSQNYSRIYKNNSGNSFSQAFNNQLTGVYQGSVLLVPIPLL